MNQKIMQFKLAAFALFISGILFAQTSVVTTQSGNLTIEWSESLQKLMAEKESCTPPPPPPRAPEFCPGARIQVFYSKSRSEAEQKLSEAKTLFPNLYANLIYNSPDYKVQVGYFESREAAESTLRKARRDFPASFIFEETVRCSLLEN